MCLMKWFSFHPQITTKLLHFSSGGYKLFVEFLDLPHLLLEVSLPQKNQPTFDGDIHGFGIVLFESFLFVWDGTAIGLFLG